MTRLIFLTTVLIAFGLNSLAQSTFFVSPDGDDCNTGSQLHPFKSIDKAKQKAREENGETVIFLREGEYRIEAPILFTSEDGNVNKSLTLRGYPGEHVAIKGSVKLSTNWKPYRDGIFQTKIEVPVDIDMLIADGQIRPMARYPNYDADAVRFNGTSADATAKSRVKKWRKPEGGFLHAMHVCDWGDFNYRITGKDKDGNLMLEGGWQNNRQIGLSEENRMVENIFEELDAPGEWYFDKSTSTLFYYPLKEEDISYVVFEVPCTKHLLELKCCSNITIEGLELTQTERTFMESYEPLLRSDWTVYRGGAILLDNTDNCLIDNCYIHNVGGNGVFFSNYNRNSAVKSSHFTDIGASAILFVGDAEAVRSPSFEYYQYVDLDSMDRQSGPKTDNYPAYCTVYDNLIHKIGLFEKQVTGVELSMCKNITVSHNSVYDTPRAGINVSEGTWGGHIIEYNDVFNTVKETGDHGSFNSWGRDRFWHPKRSVMDSIVDKEPSIILTDVVEPIVLRNNRFRCDRGWDIDLDDGSSNYYIYNNLCLNGGIKLREGFYRVVENNILVNNTFHPHVWFENSGDVFTRNIVMSPYQPIQIKDWGMEVDYNIFNDSISYCSALKDGTDVNSIVTMVKFIAPQEGDFRVAPDQVDVFRMGFQNFDMNRFGVISPHLKEMASKPEMPIIQNVNQNSDENIIAWQCYILKNLTSEGERSATGMDSIRGVYVVGFSDLSSTSDVTPLRANDVILRIDNRDINNLDDFFRAIKTSGISMHMLILRNQQPEYVTIDI